MKLYQSTIIWSQTQDSDRLTHFNFLYQQQLSNPDNTRLSPGEKRAFLGQIALKSKLAGAEASSFVLESGRSPFHGGNRGSNPLGDANHSNYLDQTAVTRVPVVSRLRGGRAAVICRAGSCASEFRFPAVLAA